MDRRTIRVDGVDRPYWLAAPATRPAVLLVVLHGTGIPAVGMAEWTGLARRGPEAGFAAVFPEAGKEQWDDFGNGRLDGSDDARFIQELISRLVADGIADPRRTVLIGLSNGAFFAERLARTGVITAASLVLVAGTARKTSREARPRPAGKMPVLMVEGTADPLVPFDGGIPHGPLTVFARRRSRRVLVNPGDRAVVAAETIAADWAAANGITALRIVEALGEISHGVRVERITWRQRESFPVVLYRIEGGGHGWPGGPQYLPALLIGRVPRDLDATGILVDFVGHNLR
ncbi:MAG TPA: hypothetical protein VIT43_04980 [Candidatus Dormibacteraeota bacterium]